MRQLKCCTGVSNSTVAELFVGGSASQGKKIKDGNAFDTEQDNKKM